MDCRSVIAVVIVAVGLLMTAAEEAKPQAASLSKRGSSCIVENRVYRHGQIFTIGDVRCVKYRCYNGNYDFVEEGCDAWGFCRLVNQPFEHDCRSYVCRSTEVLGSYNKYQIRPLGQQQCKDMHGICRRPGSYFEYVMHGQWKKRCTCRPQGMSIAYYCRD